MKHSKKRRNRLSQSINAYNVRGRSGFETLEERVLLAVDVLGYTQSNTNETQLTPATVEPGGRFGKLYETPVDGQVYAQPLVDNGITINAGQFTTTGAAGLHNVVYVATENDSLYAIDFSTGAVLWHRSFLDASNPDDALPGATSVTPVPSAAVVSTDISPVYGITGTPVIDPTNNVLYVVTFTAETVGTTIEYVQRLHAVNLSDGTDKVTPYTIGVTVPNYPVNDDTTQLYVYGSGAGSVTDPYNGTGNPVVQFDTLAENQRAGLTIENGILYVIWSSHSDGGNYHGWLAGWNISNLSTQGFQLAGVFNTSPNTIGDGIWQGGAPPIFDSAGDIIFEVGNGVGTHPNPVINSAGFPSNADYADAVMKLSVDPTTSPQEQGPNGWGFKVDDYFIPYNQVALDEADEDFGSGAPLLLPPSEGIPGAPNLLLAAGKQGVIYVINENDMGHWSSNPDDTVSQLSIYGGVYSSPVYYDGNIYYQGGYNYYANEMTISGGVLTVTSSTATTMGALPGGPSISASGNTNGIVWLEDRETNELHAYSAGSLADEIWNSDMKAGDVDAVGAFNVFGVPAVANGQVFVGTTDALVVYGLQPPTNAVPLAPAVSATTLSSTSVALNWTDATQSPNTATGYFIEQSTDDVTFTQILTAAAGTTSIDIGGLNPQTEYYFRIRGYNYVGDSSYSNVVGVVTSNGASQAPLAPSALGAVPASATSITLSWTSNATNQTGYLLDRATDALFTQNLITQSLPPTPSTFTDTANGLNPAGTYYYRLRAINASGSSANSNVATASIPVIPAKETNAVVTSVTTSQVDLSWTDNAGTTTTGIHIIRKAGDGPLVNYATLPAFNGTPPNTYTWTDDNVQPGTAYEYHIQTYNVSGYDDFAGTNAETLTLPPGALTATLNNGGVSLSWTAPTGAVSYNVYRGTVSGGETLLTSGVTATNYTDATAKPGTTYYYEVTAVNANATNVNSIPSESADSNEVSIAVPGVGLLAYEGFGGPAGELQGESDGIGWNSSATAGTVGWSVQSGNATTPGYQVNAAGLTYPGLQSSSGSASGGEGYLTAGRQLDTTGVFAAYDAAGTSQIGADGTTLWFSVLLNRQAPVGNAQTSTSVDFNNSAFPWYDNSSQIGVGYYGASSDSGGAGYWSLMVGGNVVKTSTPVTVGQTALLVLEMNFNAGGDTFNLFVNPTSLGGAAPAVASATSTGSGVTFSNVVYNAGYTAGISSIDELRVGSSYATVTPAAVKSAPLLTLVDASGPYAEAPFTATTASIEGVTPSLTYYAGTSAGGAALGGAPIAVGTYTVLASFAGSIDYTTGTASTTFTISQAEPSLTVTGGNGTYNDETYNGAPFPAIATIEGDDGVAKASLEGVIPTITYYSSIAPSGSGFTSAPSLAGSYTALASFAGSTDYTSTVASTIFTIVRATPKVTVTDASGSYNAKAYTATTVGIEGVMPSLAYYAGTSAAGTALAGAPIAAGTYTALANFTGSTDYVGGAASTTFSIGKATPSVTVTDNNGPVTGAAYVAAETVAGVGSQSTAAASLEGVTPTLTYYSGTSASGAALGAAPNAAGTYTVLASFAGSADYASASASTTFTISAVSTPPVLAIGGPAVTYIPVAGPIVIAPAATLTAGNGAFANASLSVVEPAAATYPYDRLGISSTGGLTVSGSALIYNGTTIGSFTGGGASSLAIKFNANATQAAVLAVVHNVTFNNVNTSPPTAANRTINFQLTDGLGHVGAVVTQTVSVAAKGTPSVSVIDVGGTYTSGAFAATAKVAGLGSQSTPAAALEGIAPTLIYYSGASAAGAALGHAPTAAGVYTVLSSFAGSTDYNSASAATTFTIGKAASTVTATDAGGAYNAAGYAATAAVAGVGSQAPAAASLEGVAPSRTYYSGTSAAGAGSSVAPTAVGTYTVLASFAGSADYTGAAASATFTIGKAAVTVIDNSGAYTGAAFSATPTSVEGVMLSATYYSGTSVGGAVLSGAPSTVGTYTVLASFAGSTDYNSGVASTTFTIGKATPSLTVTDKGGTSNGGAFAATYSVAGVGSQSTAAASLEGTTPSLTYYSGTSAAGAGSSVAPTAIGTYTVLASFAGSADYASAAASATFTISPAVTTPPVLAIGGSAVTYNPGKGAVAIAPAATLTTGNGAFANASLSVVEPAAATYPYDRLGIGSTGGLVVSGSSLIYNGVTIGSFTGGGASALAIKFNANATQAAVLAVVQNITFNNVNTSPPAAANRTITFQLTDGLGHVGTAVSQTVSVT